MTELFVDKIFCKILHHNKFLTKTLKINTGKIAKKIKLQNNKINKIRILSILSYALYNSFI